MDKSLLIQSPLHSFTIIVLYLLFVLKLGPYLMKTRQPFTLKTIILSYNVSQIAINTRLFFKTVDIALRVNFKCAPSDDLDLIVLPEVLDLHHSFALLKMYEFVETVFFVLRKKQRQISFLHLFHHVGTYLFVWFCGKYFPASEVIPAAPTLILCGVNTFVHIFMYTYYLLSSNDADVEHWKKYITILQLVQQIFMFVLHFVGFINEECPYPKSVVLWAGSFLFSQIYLFGSFYYKTYVKKSDNQ